MNQKRDRGAAFARATLPCPGRGTDEGADVVTRVSHGADCAASERRGHLEVEIVFRIERAATGECAKSGQDGAEILGA